MRELHWSPREKKIARQAFDEAAMSLLAAIMAEFKAKVVAVIEAGDMWAMERYLRERRREVEQLLDYRYSQFPLVFARLIAGGQIREAQLDGLSEDKLSAIREIASHWSDAA